MRKAVVVGMASALFLVGILAVYFLAFTPPKESPTPPLPPSVNKTETPKATPREPGLRLVWASPPLIDRDKLIEGGFYFRAWDWWWGYVRGMVMVSPDGRYIVVATQTGEIYIFSPNGTVIKKFEYGVGRVPYWSMAFSPDGRYLAVGISSREGEVVIYNTSSWREVAIIKLAQYLLGLSNATEATITKQPWLGVYPKDIVFYGGRIYILATEAVVDPATQTHASTRVVYDLVKFYPELRDRLNVTKYIVSRFTSISTARILAVKTGSWAVEWAWPEDGPAYTYISTIEVADGYLATGTGGPPGYTDPRGRWITGVLYVLNASSGKLVYKFAPPPLVPYFNYTYVRDVYFTPGGRLVVVFREGVYCLDHVKSAKAGSPVVLWFASVMSPIPSQAVLLPREGGGAARVVSSYIYTSNGLAGVVGDRLLIFTSGTHSTYAPPTAVAKPLVQHPNQTKLFVLNLTTGRLLYVEKFNGLLLYGKKYPFGISGCVIFVPAGHDWVTSDVSLAGVYAIDICRHVQLARFLTVPKYGVPLDLDVYGNRVYVLTAPINAASSDLEPARIVGEYRLLVLEFEQ
ncbi:WD40 repeat domain-containing protein [Pyrobaculum sp. 3827-6]|uniref:WD40 repeat domain-containing protein n=1 Tax=Pyrobaculum sp. 3827-6 TaxID=2983604 RepID=UPI0021DACEB7|nr:WD40 repeat domain-containing protein [Pyrobaculum sp. 3827-6]MCU7787539.1 WD40 repeat domain-containing protein [Pyrobaculum sp. 3827-6]